VKSADDFIYLRNYVISLLNNNICSNIACNRLDMAIVTSGNPITHFPGKLHLVKSDQIHIVYGIDTG
jgi:hypothetical protein